MQVNCKHNKLVSVDELKPHPQQTNTHSKEQIELLAKIIKFQGWRSPIVVSNQSGFIVSGHGRLAAARTLSYHKVPVDYQNFENLDQEIAYVTSDNAVAELSKIDLSILNKIIPTLGPDFDIQLLGLPKLKLDPAELPPKKDGKEVSFTPGMEYPCPHCGVPVTIKQLKEAEQPKTEDVVQ